MQIVIHVYGKDTDGDNTSNDNDMDESSDNYDDNNNYDENNDNYY